MRKATVDASGSGTHVIVAGSAGQRVLLSRFVLTFSNANTPAAQAALLSGSDVIAGPYYMVNGGEISFTVAPNDTLNVAVGEDFSIELGAGLSVAGTVEYQIGAS